LSDDASVTGDSSPLLIRPAEARDVSALGRLGALLMRVHHELDRRRFLAPGRRPEVGYGAFLGSQLHERDSVVLVAERAGVVVGYAWAALEPRAWEVLRDACGMIHDLAVDPAHRGAGVGSALLARIVDELRARGVRQVVLSTAARNIDAQRLFARHGFRPTMVEMTRDLE
jgi:ribosomal protein S18 acetylase RimI-like enzyme